MLVAVSGCSDFIGNHPGAAAILVTYRQAVDKAHIGAFCDKYGSYAGVSESDCGLSGASFAFNKHASATDVGHLSLDLHRDQRVASVLVSVVSSSGDEVIRP